MAIISSSSSDTSSESSTGSEGFWCIICFESFPTGQALGRHQNIHLIDRWLTQTDLNFPPPPECYDSDDDDSVSSGADLNLPQPPLEFDFLTEAEEESLRSLLTPNLIGDWETAAQREARETAEMLDRVELTGEEEEAPAVDVELRLRISPAEVDLELKLGL